MLLSDAVNTGRIAHLDVQPEVIKKLTFFASFFAIAYIVPSVVRRAATSTCSRACSCSAARCSRSARSGRGDALQPLQPPRELDPLLKLDQLPYSLVSDQNDRGGRLRVYGLGAEARSPTARCS